MNWRIAYLASIDEIPEVEWAALESRGNVFLRHAFLRAMERHGAVSDETGWRPCHVALRDESNRLVGAMPLYLKTHSFGDFSHDWQWSSAYQRVGLRYYPKLVTGIPYTPANGPRLLVHPQADRARVTEHLIAAAIAQAQRLGCQTWQCLYVDEVDLAAVSNEQLLLRRGCQFHWKNDGYTDFDHFLGSFSSQKRKKVKRERRSVAESGLVIEVRHGDELDAALWRDIHPLYQATFDRYGNYAALSADFFTEVSATLGRDVVVFLARDARAALVAAAICYRDAGTLYGRHWGASADYPGLHFELCYYQGIEYCLRHGLQTFEPGAQGEYKVSRGFAPVPTWSAHWIADDRMRVALQDYFLREQAHVEIYQDEMANHLPYK